MAVAGVVASHQAAQAVMAQRAVGEMLAEQQIETAVDALLNALNFTTEARILGQMIDATSTDFEFDRLVASLVQDAGRVAEGVATAVRPDVGWVRHLNLPSCARCVVLAGRVYRWSDGFLRHPGDDCTTLPTAAGNRDLVADPLDLMRQGQVRGLSQADMAALEDGADFGQVVNIRTRAAGLREAGRVLARAGRPTPEGIYRMASTRDEAVALLKQFSYVL